MITIVVRFTKYSILKLCLICLMPLTLLISPVINPVIPWMDLSPILYLRAFVWLLGLSILPGLFLLRVLKVGHLSKLTLLVFAVDLSLVIVGLTSLVLYFGKVSLASVPWILFSILVLMFSISEFFSRPGEPTCRKIVLSRMDLLLLCAIVANIIISAFVQISQRYLISGDLWVSLKAAVDISSTSNLYSVWGQNYPLFFGFILSGLSYSVGLPFLNTYVLLFPLIALNILTFFVMVKEYFKQKGKIALIASLIYAFTGGFGWLFLITSYANTDFWTASYLTQDMYFSEFFWYNIEFTYKSLALSMGFASLVACAIAVRKNSSKERVIMLTISSLLVVLSFFLHMIEPLFIVPLLVLTVYLYRKGKSWFMDVTTLVIASTLLFFFLDYMNSSYYSWLIVDKITNLFLVQVPMRNILLAIALLSISTTAFVLIKNRLHLRVGSIIEKNNLDLPKYFVVFLLLLSFLSGLYFSLSSPKPTIPIYDLMPFPWYYLTTRLGLVGILAVMGLASTKWRENWFRLASFWIIVVLIVSNVWWGSRISNYVFPAVAILAAISVDRILSPSSIFLRVNLTNTKDKVLRGVKISLKPFVTVSLILVILVFSSSSILCGATYYSLKGPSMSDDEARLFSWISQHTERNTSILVPNVYSMRLGVLTISSRDMLSYNEIPSSLSALSLDDTFSLVESRNIRYLATDNEVDYVSAPVISYLISCSTQVHQTGSLRLYALPSFSPSSVHYSVAVINRETPSFMGNISDVGWLDDSFEEGWVSQNLELTLEGQTATIRRSFAGEEVPVPSFAKDINAISTSMFPYILVRYCNSQESESAVDQIITLRNETGWYGVICNTYLPVSQSEFNTVLVRLPPNQNITNINVWMHNKNHLSTSIELKIDYIAFGSSSISHLGSVDNIRLLSISVPALWPVGYSIFPVVSRNINASIIVSTYDNYIADFVQNYPTETNFLFFASSVDFPSWGTGWHTLGVDVISGSFGRSRILIAGSHTNEDLHAFSNQLWSILSENS